jgi:hypothetical protein
VLKPKGVATLGKNARKILFTVAGSKPGEAPLTARITGTAKDGSAVSETVSLPRKAGTASTVAELKAVTEIKYAKGEVPATLDAKVAIGFGEFLGDMQDWAEGVGNMNENTIKWYRLGFVLNGYEIERDPSL